MCSPNPGNGRCDWDETKATFRVLVHSGHPLGRIIFFLKFFFKKTNFNSSCLIQLHAAENKWKRIPFRRKKKKIKPCHPKGRVSK